jgi:phospholipase D1/2
MAGWQANWDAQLKAGPGGRPFDVLLKAAKVNSGLKIYVMPWKHSPPIQTYGHALRRRDGLRLSRDSAGRS